MATPSLWSLHGGHTRRVSSYCYIGLKSTGLALYDIQGADFIPKAYRQPLPPIMQLDAPDLDDHNGDDMKHDAPS